MVEQSPIVSFMTCFICSPSSPAVLPTAALLTLSLPVFAGKKYRPESCFSNGSAKAGLRPRWNIQNQLASVGYFQQSKDGGQFFHPPSSEGGFALWAGTAARENPPARHQYEKGCRSAAFFILMTGRGIFPCRSACPKGEPPLAGRGMEKLSSIF